MGALSHFSILGFDRMAETQLDSTLFNPSPLLPLRSPSLSFSSILLWYHHNQPTFEGKRSLKITYTKFTYFPNDPNSNFPEFFIQTLRIIFLFIVENLFVKLLSGRTSFLGGKGEINSTQWVRSSWGRFEWKKSGNMSGHNYAEEDSFALRFSSLSTFSLPAPIPEWPEGQGFATGLINLGEIEVAAITTFEFIWGSHLSHDRSSSVSFYKPVGIPAGFFCFGHYCQPNSNPLNGYVLVAKYVVTPVMESGNNSGPSQTAAFMLPVDYTLVWISDDGMGIFDPRGYFWLPEAPPGYKPLGFLVTNKPTKPDLYEVRCVREDLTDKCEISSLLLETQSKFRKIPFRVEKIRPCDRGMHGKGISVGTFICSSSSNTGENMPFACLKNLDPKLHAMPTLVQIHALIQHYGPTIFFHPNELYLPCSISWFFKNGARLFKAGQSDGEPIDAEGSNLPAGYINDGEFWIDIPGGVHQREIVKRGDIDSAEVYAHVKPALGGTFTDIVMWIFCPFKGPSTLKIGPTNIAMPTIGEHVGDWEHFTLRLSNFTGELHSIYFSQHSGGVWIRPWDLEFIEGNRAVVYSSRSSHVCFPHPGTYLHGSSMLSLGVRNDCARSSFILDCSTHYKIVAAEYLGENGVDEPSWLQFMGGWGQKVIYDSRAEFDKIIARLPYLVQFSFAALLSKFPAGLFGEEGPTGPKEKSNWVGDERW